MLQTDLGSALVDRRGQLDRGLRAMRVIVGLKVALGAVVVSHVDVRWVGVLDERMLLWAQARTSQFKAMR